jgi:hypothetical protein
MPRIGVKVNSPGGNKCDPGRRPHYFGAMIPTSSSKALQFDKNEGPQQIGKAVKNGKREEPSKLLASDL